MVYWTEFPDQDGRLEQRVPVGVGVIVTVGVLVGVRVAVTVKVGVIVEVGVLVDELVGVLVGV